MTANWLATKHAVLVDTGPLYAAVDRSDQYHIRAQEELRRLEQEKLGIVVSASNVLEAYTLVMQRLGITIALRWIGEIRDGATLVHPTPNDYHAAIERLQHYPDQAVTLVDAVLAELSTRLALPVWTYDHHFDVMRTRVWR